MNVGHGNACRATGVAGLIAKPAFVHAGCKIDDVWVCKPALCNSLCATTCCSARVLFVIYKFNTCLFVCLF